MLNKTYSLYCDNAKPLISVSVFLQMGVVWKQRTGVGLFQTGGHMIPTDKLVFMFEGHCTQPPPHKSFFLRFSLPLSFSLKLVYKPYG